MFLANGSMILASSGAAEDDFASSGDFGVAGLIRAHIKALEAQGRGFEHGNEKHHSEPRAKAIDIIQLFLGCRRAGAAAADARGCPRAAPVRPAVVPRSHLAFAASRGGALVAAAVCQAVAAMTVVAVRDCVKRRRGRVLAFWWWSCWAQLVGRAVGELAI